MSRPPGVARCEVQAAAGGDSEVYVVAYGHANHTGELGQMLDRWESRARARRAG